MKRRALHFLLIGLLLLQVLLSACSSGSVTTQATATPSTVGKGGRRVTFGVVAKAVNNPFWEMMHQGAVAFAEENNIEVIYLAPTQALNVEEQTRLIEDLIERKVDGIVLAPADSKASVPSVERVNEAGIPIALANTILFGGGEYVTFSAIENYEVMTLVGQYVIDKLGGKGKVIVLEGAPGAQTAIDRSRAVVDLLAKYPDIELLASQTAEFQRAMGMQVMENLLQVHPVIDAVIATNDEMALGAIEALDAAGRLGKTMVSGFDANKDALKAILDGRMLVSADQNVGLQAADAMQALLDHLNGKTPPARIRTQAVLVDKSNVDQFKSRMEQ